MGTSLIDSADDPPAIDKFKFGLYDVTWLHVARVFVYCNDYRVP